MIPGEGCYFLPFLPLTYCGLQAGAAQLSDLPDILFHIPGSGCAKTSVTFRLIQDIKFGCYGLPKFRAVPQTKRGSSVKNIPGDAPKNINSFQTKIRSIQQQSHFNFCQIGQSITQFTCKLALSMATWHLNVWSNNVGQKQFVFSLMRSS